MGFVEIGISVFTFIAGVFLGGIKAFGEWWMTERMKQWVANRDRQRDFKRIRAKMKPLCDDIAEGIRSHGLRPIAVSPEELVVSGSFEPWTAITFDHRSSQTPYFMWADELCRRGLLIPIPGRNDPMVKWYWVSDDFTQALMR